MGTMGFGHVRKKLREMKTYFNIALMVVKS
jgi:hypothetical protein